MKKIKILGTGCAKCSQLADAVREVVESEGVEATIEKVEDIRDIMQYNVLSTPGLVVDGKVCCSGRVPSKEEIRTMLTAKPGGCCGNHAAGIGRANGSCC